MIYSFFSFLIHVLSDLLLSPAAIATSFYWTLLGIHNTFFGVSMHTVYVLLSVENVHFQQCYELQPTIAVKAIPIKIQQDSVTPYRPLVVCQLTDGSFISSNSRRSPLSKTPSRESYVRTAGILCSTFAKNPLEFAMWNPSFKNVPAFPNQEPRVLLPDKEKNKQKSAVTVDQV